MTTNVAERLAALGDTLHTATAPITADEVRAATSTADDGLASGEVVLLNVRPASRRLWRTPLVVAAAAAVIIVGLAAVVQTRPNDDNDIATTVPLTSDGRATIVDVPTGWKLAGLSDFTDNGSDPALVSRVYAADAERPETGLAIEIMSYPSIAASPAFPSDVTAVDIGGASAKQYLDDQGRNTLAFERDDRWYVLLGQQVTDDQLVVAAEHARADADGDGAVIDPSGLPGGFVEIGSGFRSFRWLLPSSTASDSNPQVAWRQGNSFDGPYVSATSVLGDGLMAAQRLWSDRVDEIQIHGLPALVITGDGSTGVVWFEQGRTWFVTGYQVGTDVVVDFATKLSGVSDREWTAMHAALAPPAATSTNGGPAQPGSLVPSGTTVFPRIDGNLVTDLGRGPTYAYYSYSSAGIETAGSTWSGALRKQRADGTIDTVRITVTSPESALPHGDNPPGRKPGVSEWNYGSGSSLYTLIDSYDVTVDGTDIDLLYEVLDSIEPTTDDGQLSGYRFPNGLPAGLVEVARPFGRTFNTGAFPTVSIHNGALTMRIDPAPIENVLGDWPDLTGTATTALGIAHFDPSNDTGIIAIELANGGTLQLTSQDLTTDQMLALVPSIDLVDEATWQAEYHPRVAIVPVIVSTTTGQIETAATEPPPPPPTEP